MPAARTQFVRSTPSVFSFNPNLPANFQQQFGEFFGFGRPVSAPGTGGFPSAPTTPGALPGLPAYGGSPAAGRIPQVPSPQATSGAAISGSSANIPSLQTLFNQVGGAYIPRFTGLSATEAANIGGLLRGEYDVGEINRMAAEGATAGGITGSDAAEVGRLRLHDREKLQRQLLGSQLFSGAAQRGAGILPIPQFLTTPEQQQAWSYLASQLAAAPDPEAAFQRALQLAREGINRGLGTTGDGGGTFAQPPSTTLSTPSVASQILSRYMPPSSASGQANTGWGFLRPTGGGPGYAVGGTGPMFKIPSGGFGTPGEVPYWFSGDPMDLVGPPGGYSSPGEVPYWYQGDPMDLVNPNA